jgi:hypothetical protein
MITKENNFIVELLVNKYIELLHGTIKTENINLKVIRWEISADPIYGYQLYAERETMTDFGYKSKSLACYNFYLSTVISKDQIVFYESFF